MRSSQIIILASIALLVAYDIFALIAWGVETTISRVLFAWASDIPIILMAPGVLIGHLFWPQYKERSHHDHKMES